MASMRRPVLRTVLLFGLPLFVACGDSGPSGPDPLDAIASVTVSPPQTTVDVGSTTQLTATVKNGRGETMNTSVTWASSVETVATTNTSGLVTGVAEGTSTITASASGKSGSSVVTVNDPFPPDQPSNVVATPISNTQVQVTWTDNSNNEDDFRIDREAAVGPVTGADGEPARVYAEVGMVGPDVTTFTDTGLESGTAYNYQVRACNENGCSDPTAIDNAISTFDELMIETAILPGGTVGVAYEQTLTAFGGDGTYLWSVSAGNLPDGLSLNAGSGVLSGMPAVEGDFPFTIQVQSGGGQTATANLSIDVVFVFGCSIQSEIPEAECDVLETLYNTTNGAGWTNSTNWLADLTPCVWAGVTCDGGTVVRLYLNSNGLSGPFPEEVTNLQNLEDLSLGWNDLTGSLPPEIAGLSKLEKMVLNSNGLSGAIPPSLGTMPNLQRIEFNNNEFTGPIPPELGNLSQLVRLDLGSNDLSGTIPPELGNLTNLNMFNLPGNQLTGSIPPELGNLGNLTWFYVQYNQLSGAIPPELGNLANLEWIILAQNQLTGSIPSELANLSKLEHLNLHNNQLTGPIPSELGILTKLTTLYLYSNQLSGVIPLGVAQLGGAIQNTQGATQCDFLPGNAGLTLLDTQAYRDADLDGDGFICEVPFPPGPAPMLNSTPGEAFFSFHPPASSDPFAPHPWPGVGQGKPPRLH